MSCKIVWWIKWKWTLICSVQAWKVGFLKRWMVPWLLLKIVMDKCGRGEILWKSFWIYMTSLAECVNAMYSDSVLNRMIISCFFELPRLLCCLERRQNLKSSVGPGWMLNQCQNSHIEKDCLLQEQVGDLLWLWGIEWHITQIPGE